MYDLFGMIFCAVAFYFVNAFVQFDFMGVTMSPISIALLNTAYRMITAVILFPFIKQIEKIVFRLIKDTAEDREEQADFDLLEERFLNYPALAIGQSHTAMNGMARKAKKNILRAMGLFANYSEERYSKVQDKENLIDKYEDKVGSYLVQLTGRAMTETQSKQVSILLHTISDFERLGDHAVNLSRSANELYRKR